MSKIIVDQIQTTGGTPFTLPSTDGTANYTLATNGSGTLSWAAPPAQGSTVPDDSHMSVGTLVSGSSRDNVYSTGEWSSSGPWTTYYNSWQDTNSRIQGVNMFMGDGYPDDGATTQAFYINDGMHNESRKFEYAHNSRVGFLRKDYFEYDNHSGQYAGIHIRAMPIRNTTSSDITRSIGAYMSAYNNDYGGAALYLYTPNTSTYSTTTSGTWTDIDQENSSSSFTNFGTKSVTIPANKTCILFGTSSTQYQTTYRMKTTNMFYNLHTFFPTTEDLVCDQRMLHALAFGRIDGASYSTDNFYKIYPVCAQLYGDRT